MQRRFYNNKATPVDIGVLFELTLCPKRAVTLKIKSMKTFIDQSKNRLALCLRRLVYKKGGITMKPERLLGACIRRQAICFTVLGLGLSACATSASDSNYALRNNIDAARARCVELARSSGYQEVAVDSVERGGQAEWKVGLVVKKDGKDRKENCQYDASTNRVRMES